MPLPSDSRTPWPPVEVALYVDEWNEHSSWYSGDPGKLLNFYGTGDVKARRRRNRRAAQFWGQDVTSMAAARRNMLHIPMPADVAATSADFLFGEPLDFEVPEAAETEEGQANAAEDRLFEILESNGIDNTILEAAEVASAVGGVYLRPTWDRDVSDDPILSIVHQDYGVPEFRFGRLVAVTFWEELVTDGKDVWRHLERHELLGSGDDRRAYILHGLYKGSVDALGTKQPLTELAETAGLVQQLDSDLGDGIQLPDEIRRILPRYVPNSLPNRRNRQRPVGRSDFQGIEGLFDSLDETWSSWVRDIRLGKARVLVPDEYLTSGGPSAGRFGSAINDRRAARGLGRVFDTDQEIFSPLSMSPTEREKPITNVQFEIRSADHLATAMQLVKEIADKAGYSAQSFMANYEGTAESGTALRMRERKSLRTTAKKERYWLDPIEQVCESLLLIDKLLLENGDTQVFRPLAIPADDAAPDMSERAQTANLLAAASAASTDTLIRLVHPEWEDEQVKAEVALIEAAKQIALPTIPGTEDDVA
jgi:A118 family predicted phage portal protein